MLVSEKNDGPSIVPLQLACNGGKPFRSPHPLLLACARMYANQRPAHSGEKAFIYSPAQPEKQVIRGMVREFVDRVFNGAAEPLLLHLVEDEQLTAKDLEEMRRAAKGGKKS